jgi:NADPH-dependent glutamate synthase beta subunit-like oxidoreductase
MDKGFSMDRALREASRCLLCHDAPCSAACPASTEPDRFIRKLRFRNLKGAAALIKKNNVFGGVCGAICPTSCLCEEGCLATGIGRPITIGRIQQFLVEYGWDVGLKPVSPAPSNGRKVAVVGAGPSGLTCAAELARDGCEVTVFERLSRAGGMLRHVIPEHRLSSDFVDREISEITGLGIEVRFDTSIENQADLENLLADGFESVYLATGSWKCMTLGVESGGTDDILDAVSFLKLAKSSTREFASLVGGKNVAVIGGGDSAMDAAVTAQRHGASDVYVIYRRSYNDMPASREAKEEALAEGINLILMTQPVGYAVEGGRVREVNLARCRPGDLDETGRRSPCIVKGSEHTFPVDLVVEAAGLVPGDWMKGFSNLELDSLNRIIVTDDHGTTSAERVFAGGDVVRGGSLVVRAVADGKKAAAQIRQMLEMRGAH